MSISPRNDAASSSAAPLIAPHGGVLIDRYLVGDAATRARHQAGQLPGWDLSPRQLNDLELLLNGAFSPLQGFLNEHDYARVVRESRLSDGTLWPIPVNLDVSEAFASALSIGERISLRDAEGAPLAILEIQSLYRPDRRAEALAVFGTDDTHHPGVAALLLRANPVYVGGRLHGLDSPRHFDFRALRETPAQTRQWFAQNGWDRVVAFQTRNPIHRAHFELTRRAAESAKAKLLLHPVVGQTKPGDVDHFTRVRAYREVLPNYPPGTARLSLLPLAMRMAGPREALWHTIIRKNFGATHFIIGRDHAGPGNDRHGVAYYAPLAAQELVLAHQDELGIEILPFPALVYSETRDQYIAATDAKPDDQVRDISGTDLRARLETGAPIPEWFTFPGVERVLRERHPVSRARGAVIFFTGLSGAGKSTLAHALISRLLESASRPITLLDGDLVRRHLSKGLGFSREDRDANVTRIGFVASEIARHGGIAVCAPIAPFAGARAQVRALVADSGEFIEVHVATSLAVCEARDRKGLYAKARSGQLAQFTGVTDPYEVPEAPELRIDADGADPYLQIEQIVALLHARGVLQNN